MKKSLLCFVRGRHRRAVSVATRFGVCLVAAILWPAGFVQSDTPSGAEKSPTAGHIRFEDRQPASGIGFVLDNATTPDKEMIDSMLGGLAVFDFDNDGSKDIFIANANVSENIDQYSHYRYRMANVVLQGSATGHFSNVSAEAGPAMKPTRAHRGAAFGDLDNDGRVDVVVVAIGEPPAVLYNVSDSGHWLALRLKGTSSNRNGLGARIRLTGASGRVQHNHATTSVGYNSSSDLRVHFGLGADTAAREIEIRWPGGATQVLKNVVADQILEVTEP